MKVRVRHQAEKTEDLGVSTLNPVPESYEHIVQGQHGHNDDGGRAYRVFHCHQARFKNAIRAPAAMSIVPATRLVSFANRGRVARCVIRPAIAP